MAWNGSDSAADVPRNGSKRRTVGSGAVPQSVPSRNGRSPFRGVFVALAIAAGAGLAWWWFSRTGDVAPSPAPKPDTPVKVTQVAQPESQTKKPEPSQGPQEPPYVEVNGRRVYRNPTNDVGRVVTNAFGKALVIERVVSPNGPMKDGKSLVPRRIFKYDSEVAIDTLMNMDVGYKSLMILPANMDQDFMNSLTAKIEIGPDDTEDEIRRKKQMIQTKKELAQRVANGEKVSQIAAETLAYYNKIADIRDNLQQEIIEMENNGAAGDELEDAYEAANIMLKEYDALPLHSPKVRKAIIRERLERKQARQHKQ